MAGILKNIIYGDDNFSPFHSITLQFAPSQENNELYSCGTTIEQEFLDASEYKNVWVEGKVSDSLIKDKKAILSSYIGKEFSIYLYKISISELTNNQYKEIEISNPGYEYEDPESHRISELKIASVKSREDEVLFQKLSLAQHSDNGFVEGILADGTSESISSEIFFPKTTKKGKEYVIPYTKYSFLTDAYIIDNISYKDMENGFYLAVKISKREMDISKIRWYFDKIEAYKYDVLETERYNSSVKAKLMFWKEKKVVTPLDIPKTFYGIVKDCYILNKEYRHDCEKAREEHLNKCVEELEKTFGRKDDSQDDLKQKTLDIMLKYKGKRKLQLS
ncbi:MAG: hypothetical protein IKT00_13095 [Prevotella sp.]|nr:hypothetical protein [Prevotella sp.]